MTTKYEEVGVDVEKEGVDAFESSIENLFPRAFCTVGRDPDLEGHGIVLHADGAGSKPVQNYIHWRETGELRWFQGIGRDVIAMNLDDIVCVGAHPIGFVDYVGLNRGLFPKREVLSALDSGFRGTLDSLERFGIDISFLGGETADLPDQMKTLDVSGTIFGRVELSDAITGDELEPGDLIIGLESGGQTDYEEEKNSGIMCNGITLARHSLMREDYGRKYPEIGSSERGYYGKFAHDEYLDELGMTVGEAIISPTRIFAPVLMKILEEYRPHIAGMVHNTGGGQAKCLALGEDIHYLKDDPIDPDPIFRLIRRESKEGWRAMFQDFNMGTGFEIMVEADYAEEILEVAERFNLGAKVIGRCERSEKGNRVTIKSQFGNFTYR